jgi:hypothetical protein
MQPPRDFQQKVDLPAVLGQFLASAKLEDLVVELVQNEIDAGSLRTVIRFSGTELVCEGDGEAISELGWKRLEMFLGAGGKVPAKEDGIGAKNHGLRTGFWLGDEIQVQSSGERVDLVLCQFPKRRVLDPGVWPRTSDSTAPARGVRVTIPYRRRNLVVPSGEGFDLPPPSPDRLRAIFEAAVADAPSRFIATVLPGREYVLELVWQAEETQILAFKCQPARLKGWPRLVRRTCCRIGPSGQTRTQVHEAVAEFPIMLARTDHAKVPRIFRRAQGVVGEISWTLDEAGRPLPCDGKLRYPIGYPDGAPGAYSGHGFHISAPFISDTTRHGLASSSERNDRLLVAAHDAAARLFKAQLLPRYGASVLDLVRQHRRPDPAAESALCRSLLATRAVLVIPKSQRGELGKPRFPRGDASIVVAFHCQTPNVVAATLFPLAPAGSQLLSAGTPAHVVGVILRVGDGKVRAWTDLDAMRELIPASNAARRDLQAHAPTSTEIRATADRLALVQRAADRESLPPSLAQKLLSLALLPTASSQWECWGRVYFSREPVPEIAGLRTPTIVHNKLTSLRILREGPLKLQRFHMDTHLAKAALGELPTASKERFFIWLTKNHELLSPATLSRLATQALWPSDGDAFVALDNLLAPKAARLAELLRGIVPRPRDDLKSFPGLRRSQRGALYLRAWPTEDELERWYGRRVEAIEAVEDVNLPQAVSLVRQLELDLAYLYEEPRVCDFVALIAAEHRTVDGAGGLASVRTLHDDNPAVRGCNLAPARLTSGPHRDLYLKLGVRLKPDPDAILEALQSRPTEGETLFRRLQAFAAEADPTLLSDCRIFPFNGQILPPVDLCLPHPQNLNLWGEWKRVWTLHALSPDRVALLVDCGIARFLTEALSVGFFTWLSAQDRNVQARHLPQALRHLRDRARGPLHWWSNRPSLACLPVRGHDDLIEFTSYNRVVSLRSSIYLPDFPELHGELLQKDRSKRLAITDVEGVSGTLFAPLRAAGVRSLRRAFGRPTTFTAVGEAFAGGATLEGVLQLLRSDRMIHELPKRLELHGVPQDHLRGSWRTILRNLTGVRIAQDLRATFLLNGRTYEVAFGAGVDPGTGLIWLDGSRAVGVQLYEAIGSHLFEEEADPLASYALMRAVEMPFESAARMKDAHDTVAEADDSTAESQPSVDPNAEDTAVRAERGHGVSDADRTPTVPNPSPLRPLSHAAVTVRASDGETRTTRSSSAASTSHLRGSVEELDQILRLKQDHYAWHCQACLGDHEVAKVTPPDTYVALAKYRRGLIEAHHVKHLQNAGAPGAANLLALCRFHHDLLGDQLTVQSVRNALSSATSAVRSFPTDQSAPYRLNGFVATLQLDIAPYTVRLFFTKEHRSTWLAA